MIKVAKIEDVPVGTSKSFMVNGQRIAVFNLGGNFYAISDVCTHDEASLSEGAVSGNIVECPWHGATFEIPTGKVLSMPATRNVQTYKVTVKDGEIFIEL